MITVLQNCKKCRQDRLYIVLFDEKDKHFAVCRDCGEKIEVDVESLIIGKVRMENKKVLARICELI